jgi:uncharacterized protein
MIRASSPAFSRIQDAIATMPVVDSHEHTLGANGSLGQHYTEPIQALVFGYVNSDLWASGASDAEIGLLADPAASTDKKWPLFQRLWAASEHTAYARATKLVLRRQYGVARLTRDSLDRVAEHLPLWREPEQGEALLRESGIRAVLSDALFSPPRERNTRTFGNPVLKAFLRGEQHPPGLLRMTLNLPYFHEIRQREYVDSVAALVDASITSLAEYEEAVFEVMRCALARGIVAFKDQSAYSRVIEYDLPPRADAERIFNRLLTDPRNQLAWPEAKPLGDYLFHQFMRNARELDLPVQLHTGHMAGIRNRVDKANAAHLASVLELHTRVRFDLFHGNWPYLGDLLFLGKNYPNVHLNLCWLPLIDPLYAVELLRRAVMTVPQVKLHGFGGDYWDAPEYTVAHLEMAREVIAAALADLVEMGWLEEDEALALAADWLYNNPNAFYRLGLPQPGRG